jgi:serine/threonine protein kinase
MDDVAFSSKDIDIIERVWGKRTPECVDFVQKLLKKKPRDRMSAKKALEHPWIINYTP